MHLVFSLDSERERLQGKYVSYWKAYSARLKEFLPLPIGCTKADIYMDCILNAGSSLQGIKLGDIIWSFLWHRTLNYPVGCALGEVEGSGQEHHIPKG